MNDIANAGYHGYEHSLNYLELKQFIWFVCLRYASDLTIF